MPFMLEADPLATPTSPTSHLPPPTTRLVVATSLQNCTDCSSLCSIPAMSALCQS